MTSTTRQRLDPGERRRQIAAAAARVFESADPTEVSFEDVAVAAGVSRSLVYKYFGDRGNLLAAAYLHDLDRLDERIRSATERCEDDQSRLRAVIDTYLDFAKDHVSASRLIASLGTLRHPAVQSAMDERVERIAEQFGGTTSAVLVARGVVGLLEAAAIHWADHAESDLQEASELLFRILWSGLNEVAGELGIDRPGDHFDVAG